MHERLPQEGWLATKVVTAGTMPRDEGRYGVGNDGTWQPR